MNLKWFKTMLLIAALSAMAVLNLEISHASASTWDENLRWKFEPDLWYKLQRLEPKSPDRYVTLIIQSASVVERDTLATSLDLNTDAKSIRPDSSLPLVTVRVKVSGVRRLALNPLVKFVWDGEALFTASMDVATETIGSNQTRSSYDVNGMGITIAILDSGINQTHPDLDDLDDNPNTTDPKVINSTSWVPYEDAQDYSGHGTWVAALAAGTGEASNGNYTGVAPGAKLINVKVLNASGMAERQWLLDALNWTINNKDVLNISVVSMSLGRVYKDPMDYGDNFTSPESLKVEEAVQKGLTVVVAQGNVADLEVQYTPGETWDDPDDPGKKLHAYPPPASPGTAPSVITVGASDDKNTVNISDDSMWIRRMGYPPVDYNVIKSRAGPVAGIRFRPKPDVVAPGTNIISAGSPGSVAWNTWPHVGDWYIEASGTSASTPLVAGTVALLLQKHPSWTPAMVKETLKSTSELNDDLATRYNRYPFGAESIRGKGLINVTKAMTPFYLTVRTYNNETNEEISGAKIWVGGALAGSSPTIDVDVGYGNHMVEAESVFTTPSYQYTFQHWENGSTSNQTIVNISGNTTLNAYYYKEVIGGCPFVYVWNGTEYVIDNNLLPASEASNGVDVEDYYVLQQILASRGNRYKLMISEFEQEHSYFDQVKLLAVDHELGVHVAVSPTGEILTFKDPSIPISAVDNHGSDVLDLLQEVDGNYYEGHAGDYILLDFGDLNIEYGAKLVMRADLPPIGKKWSVHVQVLNDIGSWETVAIVIPRVYWATEIVDLQGYLPDVNGDLKVRLYFTSSHKIDYVGLDTTPQEDYTLHQGHLLWAIHSEQGFVGWKLRFEDQVYAELLPGQTIRLTFYLPPPNSPEAQRTFLLYSKGRYFTIP